MLIFPPKPAYARLSRSFQNRNLDGLAMNFSIADLSLMLGYCEQGTVINGLDKTVTQRIESRPERADVFSRGDMFLCLWNHGPVVDDGPACDRVCPIVNRHGGIHEIAVCVTVACAELGKLASATTHGGLMALGTSSAVEYRDRES